MSETKTLQVMYDEKLVGTLAMASGHKVAFQYSEEWLEDGFSISPFSLPLKNQVFVRKRIILMAFSEYLRTVCQITGEDYY